MWRKMKREYYWALVVALAGATAGLVSGGPVSGGPVSDGPVYPGALKTALVGAIVSSAVFTAIKMSLNL